ncbi:3-hydroxybenzoate 6-hydroxylase [Bacillus sp. M6-12]|uniref:FAD-dependent monooxygenase n=1 Tax=Bacillus sp. M6-12 TaxID=2054166 RepID=UPI000C7673D3|nr:FAD-dependent monooxygenase [Bacillus sp. M6-12]PLS18609.1 3-hydroxybenzoate 6-hydroxylase [Bacillus sp. M6-12]
MQIVTSINKVSYLIIGGGIGGLAAALSIAGTGRSVHVLEQAPEFGEIGAGLQLGPNAMAVLDKFGLFEAISEFAFFPKRLVLMDAMSGKELTALDLGESFRNRYGYPYAVMHRTDLHTVLLNACRRNSRIALLNDKKVESVDNVEDQVKVTCSDGSSYMAEAVIGADGLWSKTRKLLIDDEPICSEYVAYRGTIPMEEVVSYAGLDDVTIWVGPDRHLVQYPVRRKELFNQVVVFKSYNYKKELEETTDWGTTEEMDERFSDCCETVRNAVSYIKRHRRWPLYDREPIDNWTKGRITLIGDAAHPMLQYLAQGACQAMEDAVTLGEKLNSYSNDVEKAFSKYQEERVPRTARVQKNARVFGEILHIGDEVGTLLRDTLLEQRSSEDFKAVDWLYGHYNLVNQ